MQYRPLGRTDIKVSVITLGTMTWGVQNTENDAHAQLNLAVEHGVNLVDTAEMYPVPPSPETQGDTERIFGSWLRLPGNRAKVLVATKAAGPSRKMIQSRHIRGGNTHFTRESLTQALHDSLARLQTDYIDLYQLHWPDRSTNHFGQLGYVHVDDEFTVPIEETLAILSEFVRAGKIRHIGLSNETPWGISRFVHAAQTLGLERVVTVQNPYNLLNRVFEIGNAEIAMRDQVGLLAYSPLAFGVLSGKYLNGARPQGARLTLYDRFARYNNTPADQATAAYVALANRHGLDPARLALAYVNSRPFVTSTIIGATTLEQLSIDLGSVNLALSSDVLTGIETIHARHPNPSP